MHVSTKRDVIISAPLTTYRPLTSLVRVYILIYNIFYNFLFSLLTSTPRFRCIFRSGVVIGKILIFMTITVSFGKQFESVRTMRSYLLFL